MADPQFPDGHFLEYPDEAVRFDLVPAIVFTVPSWDRDIHPEEFGKQVRKVVVDVSQTSDVASEVQVRVQHHQIGSAAEWSRTVVMVLEASVPVVGYLSGLATIAQFGLDTIRAFRRKSELDSQSGESADGVVPTVHGPNIGLQVAIGMAASHYRAKYGALDGVEVFWHARTDSRPDAVACPGGNEIYTITLIHEDERFIYTIRGDGQCIEHLMVSERRVLPLDLPNFLGVDSWKELRLSESGRVASDQMSPCYSTLAPPTS